MTIFKHTFWWCIFLLLMLMSLVVAVSNNLSRLVTLVNIIKPGMIQAQHLEGSLFSHISFDTFEYQDKRIHIRLNHGEMRWQLVSLRHPEIIVTRIQIDTVNIASQKGLEQQTKSVPSYNITLPFVKVSIQNLKINHLVMDDYLVNAIGVQAYYSPERWSIPKFQAEYEKVKLSLHADGQIGGAYPITIKLSAMPLKHTDHDAVQGQFSLVGDRSLYQWEGKLTGVAPIESRGTLRFIQDKKLVTLQGSWGDNRLNVEGDFPNRLQYNLSIPNPSILYPRFSGLKTSILATGNVQNNEGFILIKVAPGTYEPPKDSGMSFIKFEGGQLRLNLSHKMLAATGKLAIDHDKVIDIDLHLPQFQFSNNMNDQVIHGKINLSVRSLDFLNHFTKEAENIRGQALATFVLSGKLKHPEIEGTLALSNAELDLPAFGLHLRPITATLKNHGNQWSALASLGAAGGEHLDIKGEGQLFPDITGKITLIGDNFPALKTEEYHVTLSPKLTMDLQPDGYLITGSVTIPQATLKLPTFIKTTYLTDDVVVVKARSPAPTVPLTTKVDIQIKTGPNVFIDVQGLQGHVDGSLQVNQTPARPMYATGELAIRDGTYKAYNQDLTIDHGKLLFYGGPISNPIINLRAGRTFDKSSRLNSSDQLFDFNATNLQTIDFGDRLIVGVAVSGHINDPKISLFSVPATLSQADILSMLLIGKPASQASGASGQLLLTAVSAMNLDSGTKGAQLLNQFKSLGIDLDIKNSTQFNSKNNTNESRTGVVAGKAISNRLYLSYSMGLFIENSNVLTLKYLLNKYFSLQVTASDSGNGMDLLYNNHS
ncbi:MAG: DUF490 domain-containing protein [Legionella sp.]|nr:MAG: DUF490 domain-containing protein [Legionella sp.]